MGILNPVVEPRDPEFRSPLLDWMQAIRKWKVLLAACVFTGILIGIAVLLLSLELPTYRSMAVLAIEPDFVELSLAEMIGISVRQYDRAYTDAKLFEAVALGDESLLAAMLQVEATGYSYKKDSVFKVSPFDEWIEAPKFSADLAKVMRERSINMEYELGNPNVTLTVRAILPAYARELAQAIIEEGTRRLVEAREKKLDDGLAEAQRRQDEALEAKYLRARETPRPSVVVISGPTLPANPESIAGEVSFWIGLCATLGFFIGLLWIALRMHAEAMREFNPGRYGNKS